MSRSWFRTPVSTRCGRCGREVPVNGLLERIEFESALKPATRKPVRCPLCAETRPPAFVADAVLNRAAPIEPRKLLRLGQDSLPLDYKAVAAGEREPGAEG